MDNVRLSKIEKRIKEINQEIYDDVNLKDMLNTDEKIYLFGGAILFCWINVKNDDFILMSGKSEIIVNKIRDYLKSNGCIESCMNKMLSLMEKTLKKAELTVMESKMNLLEYIFVQCCTKIMPYICEHMNCDISGTIYHSLNGWQRIMDDERNDAVFTPWYVSDLMAGLAKINMNSVVLDNTMGCGSLLVPAVCRMIKDAEKEIKNEDRLKKIIDNIKGNQIKGVEMLTTIYFLAVLNMSLYLICL